MENKFENQLGFFNHSYTSQNDTYVMILTENFKKHIEKPSSPKYKLLVIDRQNNQIISSQKGYLDLPMYSKISEKGNKYYFAVDDYNFYSLYENEENRKSNPKSPYYRINYNPKNTTKETNNNNTLHVKLDDGNVLEFNNIDIIDEEVPF